ncbi:HpcH/HpaI aldolase/citrate lyase family protein [Alterisphingorhabdus coralli]|uniref:CoA ester lyase n=1 Tax=Alterisphingorhabdus coralli TaxID=3071408 RepID=A0AA97F750_9SPHN|nr:CoA ester lyase [Parasphingorhabdus sp. SCSIO 66989]WOE75166.1 CoA ester lyase [Parasphingorhabdus sp. SCSIO 66989]
MTAHCQLPLRAMLFVPGDSARKQEKSLTSGADAVIIDLEDSVVPEKRAEARQLTHDFIAAHKHDADAPDLWLRINPLDTRDAIDDLETALDADPVGIVLPKCTGPEQVAELDHLLFERERKANLREGSTAILPIVTETPGAAMTLHRYLEGKFAGKARLAGLSWGAEDLSAAIGASRKRKADGSWTFPYQMVRAQVLLTAHALDVQAIDTLHADFRDTEGLIAYAQAGRSDGFSGMLAIHPAQVEPIQTAFTPSDEEIAEAEAVVAAFAENPGAGAVSLDGKMLDRPHLKLAERILAQQ